jgi:hypothetical protein
MVCKRRRARDAPADEKESPLDGARGLVRTLADEFESAVHDPFDPWTGATF